MTVSEGSPQHKSKGSPWIKELKYSPEIAVKSEFISLKMARIIEKLHETNPMWSGNKSLETALLTTTEF